MKASSFFSKEQQAQILESVREAESETSGEIRVHIESSLKGDVLDRAAWLFKKLGMHKTAERNGVIGDSGINAKVPAGFWDDISELLKKNFKEARFTEGLSEGILIAGEHLKIHFPHRLDDVNELPDEISFDK